MTPGLARGPPFPKKATKYSTVAVASLEVPSVPLVVGSCEIDVCALAEVRGAKGHAVRSLHWTGDELWAWSQAGKSGVPAPVHIKGWDDENQEESSNLHKSVADLTLSEPNIDQEDYTADVEQPLRGHTDDQQKYLDGKDEQPFEEVSFEHKETSTKGMISNRNFAQAKALIVFQKLTMLSAMLSYLLCILNAPDIPITPVMVSNFLYRSHC